MTSRNPKRPRRKKPARRLPPETLAAEEVALLLGACGRYTWQALRHRALIALLYRAGQRVGEALALLPKDLDLQAGTARILHGKGDRSRVVGLDAGACAVVAEWMACRDRMLPPEKRGSSPIICTRSGGPLTTAYVRRLMKRLGRQAGIAKRVHAHGLRHTHASELRAEGVDIGIISRQLGHRSILTTIRYLDHIAPWSVVEAIKARKW